MSKFRDKLLAISRDDFPESELGRASDELMQTFLDECSETEDNLNCFAHVEFGLVDGLGYGTGREYGLKVKGKNILLSDVINNLENMAVPPAEVREGFPTLTAAEWSGVLRMTTVVLLSLEREG